MQDLTWSEALDLELLLRKPEPLDEATRHRLVDILGAYAEAEELAAKHAEAVEELEEAEARASEQDDRISDLECELDAAERINRALFRDLAGGLDALPAARRLAETFRDRLLAALSALPDDARPDDAFRAAEEVIRAFMAARP